MLRKGTYNIDQVFDWMEENASHDSLKEFDGVMALSNLLSYKVFKHKGIKCVCGCNIIGEYFALEKTVGPPGRTPYTNWHFNLYGKDIYGNEVMMTKDHTLAKSNGGSDDLLNLEPMCQPSNTKKGSKSVYEFKETHPKNVMEIYEYVKTRIKECYDMEISLKDFGHINKISKKGINIHIVSESKKLKKIEFKNTIFVIYSSVSKSVVDVIEPYTNKVIDSMREVPNFGKGKEELCLFEYDKIISVVESEYKQYHDPVERTKYYTNSTYPRLMFYKWKGMEYQMRKYAWVMVKENLNLK